MSPEIRNRPHAGSERRCTHRSAGPARAALHRQRAEAGEFSRRRYSQGPPSPHAVVPHRRGGYDQPMPPWIEYEPQTTSDARRSPLPDEPPPEDQYVMIVGAIVVLTVFAGMGMLWWVGGGQP